jgi:Tat protein translocase TatB subunit
MANIGSSELFLLFVVALLVLGPERLPKVASQVGRWVGRARRVADQLRRQLEREISLSEMKSEAPGDFLRPDDSASNRASCESNPAGTAAQVNEPPCAVEEPRRQELREASAQESGH